MSSLAAHRAAILAKLQTVAQLGVLHDEEPYARDNAAFQAKYLWDLGSGQKQLRGWFFRRTATREMTLGVGRVMNAHTWRLQGFMALNPPDSGKTFDGLIEAMRQAFRADETLGGIAAPGPLNNPTGVQVLDSGPVSFTGVLCHGATLQLTTYAYLNPED
tara:strand:+ start:15540 stop:16019 length:480 start_codon:yes stop_codon:yes gene_type:complete